MAETDAIINKVPKVPLTLPLLKKKNKINFPYYALIFISSFACIERRCIYTYLIEEIPRDCREKKHELTLTIDFIQPSSRRISPQCKYRFSPEADSLRRCGARRWIFMPVMTRIIVVRARILKKLEGTTPLCTPRAFLEGPRGGCARNSVVNSTTIGGLENTIAITPRVRWWKKRMGRARATRRGGLRGRNIKRERASERWFKAIKMPPSAICFNINKLRSLIDFVPCNRKLQGER